MTLDVAQQTASTQAAHIVEGASVAVAASLVTVPWWFPYFDTYVHMAFVPMGFIAFALIVWSRWLDIKIKRRRLRNMH